MSVFEIVIIAVVVFAPFLVFCTPQSVFSLLFPDSMYAIIAFRTLVNTESVEDCHKYYDEKTIKLLTTWNLLEVEIEVFEENAPPEVVTMTTLTKKGIEFTKKYPKINYGIRFFVIGKLLQRLLKFTLPFIGANILFVWYKYFENYLEKLFDMCP